MKRLLMVVIGVAALASMASMASAGDYHVGKLLVCSDCHIMHGSQKHGYATDADTTWLGPHTEDPPYAKLLRGETVNNACLNCHDGKMTAPDVLNDATNPPTNGRSAGALNVPNAGAHGYANTGVYTQGDGHTLWSTDAPPGATAGAPVIGTEGLECTDCHGAHGNKYFRNMQGAVSTSTATYIPTAFKGKEVSYVIGSTSIPNPNTGAAGVWVLEKTAANYDNANVAYLEPDQTVSMYGAWCGSCHGDFHGNTTAANIEIGGEIVRHPTAGVDIGTGTGTSTTGWNVTDPTHRLKLMDNTATWDGTSTTMTPSCFTCHKSHGNANKFGLVFVLPQGDASSPTAPLPAGSTIDPRLVAVARSATMGEEGDGTQYRDLCRNCHGMGRWPTGNPTNLQH